MSHFLIFQWSAFPWRRGGHVHSIFSVHQSGSWCESGKWTLFSVQADLPPDYWLYIRLGEVGGEPPTFYSSYYTYVSWDSWHRPTYSCCYWLHAKLGCWKWYSHVCLYNICICGQVSCVFECTVDGWTGVYVLVVCGHVVVHAACVLLGSMCVHADVCLFVCVYMFVLCTMCALVRVTVYLQWCYT